MRIKRCDACDHILRLVRMPSGKLQPCELDAAYLAVDGGKQRAIRIDNLDVITGTLHAARPNDQAVRVWVPHWGNCSDPARFRRKPPPGHSAVAKADGP